MTQHHRVVEAAQVVRDYMDDVQAQLSDLPPELRDRLVEEAQARIELEMDLQGSDPDAVRSCLERLGDPITFSGRLRSGIPAGNVVAPEPVQVQELTGCRVCRKEVAQEAHACPHCGARFPAQLEWSGTGYEYKSKATLWGWPLVHVAVGRDAKGKLRVARGIIAIGQFGIGAITIAQFGVGFLFGLGQFMLAPISIGQFAAGLIAIGQFGFGLLYGAGMISSGIVSHGFVKIGNWFR